MKFSPLALATLLLGISSLAACKGDGLGDPLDAGLGGAGNTKEEIDESPHSPLSLKNANLLFDAEKVPVFDLTLPEESWETMQKEALEEEYVTAHLRFDGKNMGEVGLRFKGSWGSLNLCLDEEGNLLCSKLGMKIKFSGIDEDERFYGLKRLNFHGMVHDESKMAEKVGYKLYRDMGIAAPRSSWAVLSINGKSLGLFALVEQIDGRFTKDRWPEDGDGNLYKETWPITSDEQWYQNGLKTNEETASHNQIIAFHEDMAASDDESLLDTLKRWSDPEALATYMAVDDAISNWDGVTAWYDWGDFYTSHNAYWYQHDKDDSFTLIPWDLDSVLLPYIPTGETPHWTTVPEDCDQIYTIWGNVNTKAPGCTPIFRALASERKSYEDAADRLLDGPFDLERLSDQIDEYAEMIRDAVQEDPTGTGLEGWEDAVSDLKNNLALHRLKFEALRAQRALPTSTLSISGVNDFESLEPYSVILGMEVYSNTHSSASRTVNTDSPLLGEQDIRLEFAYRDEPGVDWGQWSSNIFQIKEGVVDVRELSGIRLHLRSDGPSRNVQIGLESRASSQAAAGVLFGWLVQATASSTEIEVLFADAEIPSWAPPNDDVLEDVLRAVYGLAVQPQVVQNSGYLGEGVVDMGSVQIDNIEFF